jgi:hypothetical protein
MTLQTRRTPLPGKAILQFRALSLMIAVAVVGTIPDRADAGQIGAGDFDGSAQITTFNGLGPLVPTVRPAPLEIDGHTINTDDGEYRYINSTFCAFDGECIGTDTGLGFLDIVLAASYAKAGAYVAGAQAAGYSIRAEFFDASDVLLGTFDVNNAANRDFIFAGWEDTTVGVARMRFTDLNDVGEIEILDDLTVQTVVPEPSTALLTCLGLMGLPLAGRRRRARA